MSFIESPRFPEKISYSSRGGPMLNTSVVRTNGGSEQRSQIWSAPLHTFDVMHGVKSDADLDTLQAFFMAVAVGRFNGFRFKNWKDYLVPYNGNTGILNTSGQGNGTPTSQLYKLYTQGSSSATRKIIKPVAGTVAVTRNGSAATFGVSAGNIAIDTTTGVITWVADATSNASAISVGSTTSVILAANLGLTTGGLLYLSGFTGADAALVNGIAHTINSRSGTGPYTFVLATNTSGKTITVGSGAGAKYPQITDALVWTGQFDTPVRFDTDQFDASYDDINASSVQIKITELRNP